MPSHAPRQRTPIPRLYPHITRGPLARDDRYLARLTRHRHAEDYRAYLRHAAADYAATIDPGIVLSQHRYDAASDALLPIASYARNRGRYTPHAARSVTYRCATCAALARAGDAVQIRCPLCYLARIRHRFALARMRYQRQQTVQHNADTAHAYAARIGRAYARKVRKQRRKYAHIIDAGW